MADQYQRKRHWNALYASRVERVSWFQPVPSTSLALIAAAGAGPGTSLIDVGGGDSRLVDHLLAQGVTCVTVLDVSGAALDRAKARLGPQGSVPRWLEADVTENWETDKVDIWHDRAAFHFLTDPKDRAAYLQHVAASVKPGGHVIIATFAADGPERCSGLPVLRYSPEALAHEFREYATMVRTVSERHRTPTGGVQAFTYSLMKVLKA